MIGRRLAGWRAAITASRARYFDRHQRPLTLFAPRRYTEKLQWRKLFDSNPALPILCDKLAVRDFIAARITEPVLIPLLWCGTEIPFDDLTPPYVLKSNHAFGHVIMVRSPPRDRDTIRARAAAWLTHCHGTAAGEPGYIAVPRRLMAERLITNDAGGVPEEVRLFVFDGKVAVLNTVLVENGRIRNGAFHTPDWTRLDWHFSRLVEREFPPPPRLADMITIAEALGAGFDHVRVDIYDCGRRLYVGEITNYSWSGLSPFRPDEADFLLGAHWRLRRPWLRALATMLTRDHPVFAKP